ncbi:MAG: hypothetical protein ACPHVP_05445 [Flavobacteriales bacterium]|tara:strand:+ start:320 stop:520 length:201 start_codon:yes stop_codon:yes gene_type:complete
MDSKEIKKEQIYAWRKLNKEKYNKYMKNYMKTYKKNITRKGLKRELIPTKKDFEYDESGKVILKFN